MPDHTARVKCPELGPLGPMPVSWWTQSILETSRALRGCRGPGRLGTGFRHAQGRWLRLEKMPVPWGLLGDPAPLIAACGAGQNTPGPSRERAYKAQQGGTQRDQGPPPRPLEWGLGEPGGGQGEMRPQECEGRRQAKAPATFQFPSPTQGTWARWVRGDMVWGRGTAHSLLLCYEPPSQEARASEGKGARADASVDGLIQGQVVALLEVQEVEPVRGLARVEALPLQSRLLDFEGACGGRRRWGRSQAGQGASRSSHTPQSPSSPPGLKKEKSGVYL